MNLICLKIEKPEIDLLKKNGVLSYLNDGAKDQEHESCYLLLAATFYLDLLLRKFKFGIAKTMHDNMMFSRIYYNKSTDYPIVPQELGAIIFIKRKIGQMSRESGREEREIFEIINSAIINIIILKEWIIT